jgi:uncharacterized membrane protein
MQINRIFMEFNRRMNTKYLVVVAAMTAMLIGATALVSDDVFAGKKKGYEKSQANAQANDCGNGEISAANFCQDIGAQNQGEENSASQAGNQEINLDIGLGGGTVTPVSER